MKSTHRVDRASLIRIWRSDPSVRNFRGHSGRIINFVIIIILSMFSANPPCLAPDTSLGILNVRITLDSNLRINSGIVLFNWLGQAIITWSVNQVEFSLGKCQKIKRDVWTKLHEWLRSGSWKGWRLTVSHDILSPRECSIARLFSLYLLNGLVS